jgi:hypothetical protein
MDPIEALCHIMARPINGVIEFAEKRNLGRYLYPFTGGKQPLVSERTEF